MPFPELTSFEIWLFISAAGAIGACLGSFFNVALYRIPRDESVVRPASHCPACGCDIKPRHNIPILSYIFLRGKCSECGSSINIRYPAVELLSAGVSLSVCILVLKFKDSMLIDTALCFYIFSMLSIPVILLDLKYFIIPDIFTCPMFFTGFLISFLPGGLTPIQSLAGAISAGGLFWLFGFTAGRILKKEALGFGDVKLICAAGSMFGFSAAVMGIFAGSVLGIIYALVLLVTRKFQKSQLIPFGPFLCLGVLNWVLFGNFFFNWYLSSIT